MKSNKNPPILSFISSSSLDEKKAKRDRTNLRKNSLNLKGLPEHLFAESDSIRSAISKPGALPVPRKSNSEIVRDESSESVSVKKEYCMYFTPLGPIPGFLSVGPYVITFEPDLRFYEVQKHGYGGYQAYIDLKDVSACATVMIPGGPFLTRYLGFDVDADINSSLNDHSGPAFFQVLMKKRVRLNYDSIPKPGDTCPNLPTSENSTPTTTEKVNLSSTNFILLFWFKQYSTVKQFTIYAINLIDERESANSKDTHKITYFSSDENLLAKSDSSIIYSNSRITLTSIPHSSNDVFEILLLSTDTQSSLLAQAETRLSQRKKRLDIPFLITFMMQHIPKHRTPASLSSKSSSAEQISFSANCPILIIQEGAPLVMVEKVAVQLASNISPSLSIQTWKMCFCTKVDGISYKTFYRKVTNIGPLIILVVDTKGALFGVFCPNGIHESSRYYGNGETFVFSFKQLKKKGASPNPNDLKNISETWEKINVYRWSCRNSFFIFTNASMIAVGGGGNYAILIDSNFLHGSSQQCETFQNPCLASSNEFVIQQFQVWGFD